MGNRLAAIVKILKEPGIGAFSCKHLAHRLTEANLEEVSERTVRRDIAHLRNDLKAPIEYDGSERGWYLVDKTYWLPQLFLEETELFNALFATDVATALLPAPLRQAFSELRTTQLAAGVPGNVDLGKLSTLVIGTCGAVIADPSAMSKAVEGWRLGRRIRMEYRASRSNPVAVYDVEVHALFLSEDAWYIRASCLQQKGRLLTLALHRILHCELLADTYDHRPEVVEDVRKGNVFNYRMAKNVKIICPASKEADYISERAWFGGCRPTVTDDGCVVLEIPEVSEPYLLQWVLQFGGGVEIKEPAALRKTLAKHAQLMAKEHGDA